MSTTLKKFRQGLMKYLETEFDFVVPDNYKNIGDIEFSVHFKTHITPYLISRDFDYAEQKFRDLIETSTEYEFPNLTVEQRYKIIRFLCAIDETIG